MMEVSWFFLLLLDSFWCSFIYLNSPLPRFITTGNVVSDPRNGGEFNNKGENGRKLAKENRNITKLKQQASNEVDLVVKENKNQQVNKQEAVVKPSKPSNAIYGPGRPPRQNNEQKVKHEARIQQKFDNSSIQRRPPCGLQNVSKWNGWWFELKFYILLLFLVVLEIQVFGWRCS